jgi:hypothetical protein
LVFKNSSIGVFRACNLRGNLASPKNVIHSKETSLKSQLHIIHSCAPSYCCWFKAPNQIETNFGLSKSWTKVPLILETYKLPKSAHANTKLAKGNFSFLKKFLEIESSSTWEYTTNKTGGMMHYTAWEYLLLNTWSRWRSSTIQS